MENSHTLMTRSLATLQRYRLVLLLLLATLLIAARPQRVAAQTKIVAGPMVGHVSDTSARLWMQINTSEQVSVKTYDLVSNDQIGAVRIDVEGPAPFVFDAPLSGLRPNHDYRIEVLFDGKPVTLPEPQVVVRTAPPPGEAATYTLGFGSCMSPAAVAAAGGGGGNLTVFKAINRLSPRAFLFLGNTGYLPVDLKDWPRTRRQGVRMLCDFQHNVRVAPALQGLLHTSAIYDMWDEHDFGAADADRNFPFAKESRAAFMQFWPNPDYGTPEAGGIFYKFTLGDVDVFVLDNRSFRVNPPSSATTNPSPDAADATAPDQPPALLGEDQLAWLKAGLLKSHATFKIIACPTPLLPDYAPATGQWAQFKSERDTFFSWLRDNRPAGVVFISGGGGIGELTVRRPPEKASAEYPLYELTAPPLAVPAAAISEDNRPANPLHEGPQVLGSTLGGQCFGTLDFGGPKSKRHLTLRLRDAEGKIRLEKVLFASELVGGQ